jgi:hypothetical protein
MSSTNRSNVRDFHVLDYYVTPIEPILQFFERFCEEDYLYTSKNDVFLDPCAGGDIDNEMSYPKALRKFGFDGVIETIDIREDSLAQRKENFLKFQEPYKYDVVITNPPFNIALDIINKSFDVVKDGGFIIMLLRLNFFGGQKRKEFWKENMPLYSFVHSKRMSFTKNGSTDSIEYMHCVWKKGLRTKSTKLFIV